MAINRFEYPIDLEEVLCVLENILNETRESERGSIPMYRTEILTWVIEKLKTQEQPCFIEETELYLEE